MDHNAVGPEAGNVNQTHTQTTTAHPHPAPHTEHTHTYDDPIAQAFAAYEERKEQYTQDDSTLASVLRSAHAKAQQEQEQQDQAAGEGAGAASELLLTLTGQDPGYTVPTQTTLSGSSYEIDEDGVWYEYLKNKVYERKLIAFRPFIPVRRMRDDQGGYQYEIAWLDTQGEVQRFCMTAGQIANRAEFVKAFPDVVVTSVHSSDCVEYMSQCLRFNRQWLEERVTVAAAALGWAADLEPGEMDVARFVSGPGRPCHVQDVKNTGAWLEGHTTQGRADEWTAAVMDAADRPLVLGMVSAAFAAPLLRIVGAANFVVDLSGSTSGGKTIALSAAAAVWGDPKRVLTSWKNTRVAQEHHLSMLRGMPFFVDETQLAEEKAVEELLYGLTDGKSRGRSRQDGSAMLDSQKWETVLLTTGEQPLTSLTKKGGLSPRIVALTGQPCRDKKQADGLRKAARQSYGHAGESFLQRVGMLGDEAVQGRYEVVKEELAQAAETPVAARRADSVAVLAVANEIAAQAGLMPLVAQETWRWMVNGSDSAVTEDEDDRPKAALREVLSWAVGNPHRFYGHSVTVADMPPSAGWAGRWQEGEYVSFEPEVLRKIVRDLGHDYGRVLLDWKERGWLAHDRGKNTKKTVMGARMAAGGYPCSNQVRITNLETLIGRPEELEGFEEETRVFGAAEMRRWALGAG